MHGYEFCIFHVITLETTYQKNSKFMINYQSRTGLTMFNIHVKHDFPLINNIDRKLAGQNIYRCTLSVGIVKRYGR